MRQLACLTDQQQAHQWAAWLVKKGLEIRLQGELENQSGGTGAVEAASNEWTLWVVDDDQLAEAREQMTRLRNGEVTEFPEVDKAAFIKAAPKAPPRPQTGNKGRPIDWSRDRDLMRQEKLPVIVFVIVVSTLASLATNFASLDNDRNVIPGISGQGLREEMSFVGWDAYLKSGGDPLAQIREGQVWRLITPMFLHGDEMHLVFNMLCIFVLGSTIERVHGSFFILALLIVTQISGMLLQALVPPLDWIPEFLHGNPHAIGASGAAYGLLGFLWIRPLVDRNYPIQLDPLNVVMMLGWLVYCMTPYMQGVANGAHLGGLLAGMAVATIKPFGTYRLASQ
ncbi:MAG: rhomboid family intramembrane serine protease [Planctomycetota bacterium]